jgi:hypothetical protein
MLATVLPKLTSLKVFRCQMSNEALGPLLGILETSHPNLRGLTIAYALFLVSFHSTPLIMIFCRSTSSSPPLFPALRSLNRFVYSGKDDGALLAVDGFLSTQTVALHTLVIHHTQIYPAPYLPTSSLRNLFLTLTVSKAEFLSQLLVHGQELECLRLEVNLEHGCLLSTVFRAHAKSNSFPALRKLSFVLNTAVNSFSDRDLFPAVAEFVRAHPMLDALCMSNVQRLSGFGFDAAIWGMLPSLSNLRTLSIDVPKDLHFALSAWLIPRGVTALELRVHRPAATPVVDLTVRYPFSSSVVGATSLLTYAAIIAWTAKRTQVPLLAFCSPRNRHLHPKRSPGAPPRTPPRLQFLHRSRHKWRNGTGTMARPAREVLFRRLLGTVELRGTEIPVPKVL